MEGPVHYSAVGEEGDDPHRAVALRADRRIDLAKLANHARPKKSGLPFDRRLTEIT